MASKGTSEGKNRPKRSGFLRSCADNTAIREDVYKHTLRDDGRPAEHSALQLAMPARELSDEILLVSRPFLAAAKLRGGGREGQDSGIRPGQDGRGLRGQSARAYHQLGGEKIPQEAGHRAEAYEPGVQSDGRMFRSEIRVAARAQKQSGSFELIHQQFAVRGFGGGAEILRGRRGRLRHEARSQQLPHGEERGEREDEQGWEYAHAYW